MKFKKIGEDFEEDRYDESDYYEEGAYISEEEVEIGNKLTDILQGLINGEVLSEEWVSEPCLHQHFIDHCICNHPNEKSTLHNIFYDFENKDKYRTYTNGILDKVSATEYIVSSLFDTELCYKYFRKLFEGGVSILFLLSCNLRNDKGPVQIGLHSFTGDATKSYMGGNAIDLLIISAKGKLISQYPIDAHYLETKINNIFGNDYSGNGELPKYTFNND